MKYYETLMLVRTETTGDEISFLERSFEERVAEVGGITGMFDKWGKLRLAYPVQKQEYGVYILSRYSLPSDSVSKFLKELDAFFKIKCHEFVMRFTSVRQDGPGKAEYRRPEAVDASSSRRTRSFSGRDGFSDRSKSRRSASMPLVEGVTEEITDSDMKKVEAERVSEAVEEKKEVVSPEASKEVTPSEAPKDDLVEEQPSSTEDENQGGGSGEEN